MNPKPKKTKIKPIVAWMYIWEDGSKQVLFKKLAKKTYIPLKLKEVKVLIQPMKHKHKWVISGNFDCQKSDCGSLERCDIGDCRYYRCPKHKELLLPKNGRPEPITKRN